MLSNKKTFVITIGDFGAVVALHDGNEIKNKIFLEELSEESKIDLKNLFNKNQSAPMSVMLDTIDQSYKKKTYPLIKKGDLTHIIKRDLASDGDNGSFKGYILANEQKNTQKKNQTKATAKRDCLFISTSTSETINKWLDFLLDMPNRLVGIYMLPVESFKLFELLKRDVDLNSRAKNVAAENIYFLIVQNKVSGVRQIIFSDHGILFTRSVNYEFAEKDFAEKYVHDIYSTFEYLKRLLPDLRLSEIDIVNIFSNEVLSTIKDITSSELNFSNYTPFEAASKVGYNKILPESANYCDLLLSKVFANSKKILKFSTPRINLLERFFLGLRASYALNVFLAAAIFIAAIVVFLFSNETRDLLAKAEAAKVEALQEFSSISLPSSDVSDLTENGNVVVIERVIDFGKINEALTSVGTDFSKYYINLRFLKESDVRLSSFSYSLQSFDYKIPATKPKYIVAFKGDLANKSGDIDDLFKAFDSLAANAKRSFPQDTVRYVDIPRNIDFVQKYYTLPIDFTVSNK